MRDNLKLTDFMTMNRYGVKDASDCRRTINGLLYLAHMSCPSAERIALYRKAGIRCRRQGDELYVAFLDQDQANDIDANNPLQ